LPIISLSVTAGSEKVGEGFQESGLTVRNIPSLTAQHQQREGGRGEKKGDGEREGIERVRRERGVYKETDQCRPNGKHIQLVICMLWYAPTDT
jgi:hypothetical protein